MWWLTAALLLAQNPYRDAGAALASGDLQAAQKSLEALTLKDPRNPRAWMLLAQTYARRKNPTAALAAAKKSETLGARDPEVLHGLAIFFTNLQPDLAHAADLESRYAELQPNDKLAWRRASLIYIDAAQYDRAIITALRGLPGDDTKELHTALARAYEANQDWPHAAVHFTAAVTLAPFDENAHFLLIQFYLQHEDFQHATEAIVNARKIFSRSPQIELAAGVCAYGLRHFGEAQDQFLKTIALAPDVPQPYQFLGRMLDHAGDRLPEITTRFRQFHERHPNDPTASVLYAKALIASSPQDADEAMQLLEQARANDDNQPEVHYQLGCLLERKRDYPAAAAELERSIALDPREPLAHFHLARVYERQGRKEDALRERDRHQKLTESTPEAQIENLLDDVATSGRILEAGDLTDRLGTRRQLAPGRPPLLEFRYLEGAARHRFGTLDLVIDDAGH